MRHALIAVTAILAAMVAAPPAIALDVKIVNKSGRSDERIYVMLNGGSSADGKLVDNSPKRLSDLSGRRFSLKPDLGSGYRLSMPGATYSRASATAPTP